MRRSALPVAWSQAEPSLLSSMVSAFDLKLAERELTGPAGQLDGLLQQLARGSVVSSVSFANSSIRRCLLRPTVGLRGRRRKKRSRPTGASILRR